MTAPHLAFHVEEQSMEAFLRAWLPRFYPESFSFDVHPYRGKQNLLKNLGNRLKGYAEWMPPEYRVVVVVDRDDDCCESLKSELEEACAHAGLDSRPIASPDDWQVVTRIAIEELEAWYFGNWQAVCAAYPNVSLNIPRRSSYRNPDAIKGGTWEAFERVMQKHGYFKQGLAKVEAATEIGKHFDPAACNSPSFILFRDAIIEAVA